jgi:hypothetical protein
MIINDVYQCSFLSLQQGFLLSLNFEIFTGKDFLFILGKDFLKTKLINKAKYL